MLLLGSLLTEAVNHLIQGSVSSRYSGKGVEFWECERGHASPEVHSGAFLALISNPKGGHLGSKVGGLQGS